MDILSLIGREFDLFSNDIKNFEEELHNLVSENGFLVIGGAGSIGQAVVKEIFKRNPKILHVVDLSENNVVELVRDIRSSLGYIKGDFATFVLDCGSNEFQSFIESNKNNYDYILNLSALKHVRSEKDPFTLMRMVDVNIMNTDQNIGLFLNSKLKKYFAVSTDKAANPVNMMGASKRIMEMFLMRRSLEVKISTARFANVAFSDGSLLHGFNQRMLKGQPISAPLDIKRYFVTPQESGELCLFSCLLGENRDIFFPRLDEKIDLLSFSEIAKRFLSSLGYEPLICETEEEARLSMKVALGDKKWPCYFFKSDTTGEKAFEEFFTDNEILDFSRFESIGIIKNDPLFDEKMLSYFIDRIATLKKSRKWTRENIIELFNKMIPEFHHMETGKFLDSRM
jgi:FlaA1/EpsC-like NDP-sugar epimerase